MRCGLIGRKLGHSYSKIIHDMIGKYEYDLLETEPDNLKRRLDDASYSGFNVTIPYKEAVIGLCDSISDEARSIGSVNTVKRLPDGRLIGHNTDYEGLRTMVGRAGIDLRSKKVAVLGSGGTGKTAVAVARRAGADEIVVVSRGGEVNYDNIGSHADIQVIFNTTPVGMYPDSGAFPLSLSSFPRLEGVVDVIYNPARTRLLQQSAELGVKCTGGLYMLVRQAVAAAEIFTESPLPGADQEIYGRLGAGIKNIVLIGMPGSGKTTIGKLVANKLGRPFIDTDRLIAEREGMGIPDIFKKRGEGHFRQIEAAVIEECSKLTGAVIAVGGGSPVFEENCLNLRQNSVVFLLARDIDKLATEGRPLSSDADALHRMAVEREPHYERCADAKIANNAHADAAAQAVVERFYSACTPKT